MNIKIHATLVLTTCTVTGLILGGFLADRYGHIEQRIRDVAPTSKTMMHVEQLNDVAGLLLGANDRVLHKNDSTMVAASIREANRLRLLLADIGDSALAANQQGTTDNLRENVDAISVLILRARDHTGPDRLDRIAEIAQQADVLASDLLRDIGDFGETLQRRADYIKKDLEDQRDLLGLLALLAAFVYFSVIWFCWLWIVHRVVKPIEDLSAAAGAADHQDREFVLPQTGPDEVRTLTENISSFVSKLQDAKAHTEEEVRDRTAELVQASKAKGQFIATMSHELRTPLNGIINMNELILETELNEEQSGFARTAKNAAEALLALINDILDFSKIEARKLELEAVSLDLRQLVDGAVAILAGVAEGKHLELQAVVDSKVPACMKGDPTRLRQVLINLLNNALKFTREGSVCLHVGLIEESEIDATLRIEVRDTGIGIPEDRRSSLFRAFEQVDSSTTRKFGGTGLGLAICRELVGLMHGQIDVDSVEGEGSTFWFTVCLAKVADASPEPVATAADGVLVVSRRPLVRDRILAQLHHLGLREEATVAVEDVVDWQVLADEKWWAIVDPYERGSDAAAEVERALSCSALVRDRVVVLDHWMRHWTDEMGPMPEQVNGLTDPCSLEQLAGWLSGDATAGDISKSVRGRIPDAAAVVATKEPSSVSIEPDKSCRGRVLVVEDNAVNQRVVRSILERERYDVVMAGDGQEAVDAFTSEQFDLVLMDCQMPVMDGLEATRQIRAYENECSAASSVPSRVPIVALTANAEEGFSEQCFDAGMDRFLAKPCRKKPLLDTLSELLPGNAAGTASRELVRILVADDSPINRKVAQSVLGRAGYEIVCVEDGQQAVEELQRTAFGIVLMDCQMPVLDGLEATRRIRELEAQGALAAGMAQPLPVVAMTGNSQDSDREAALESGMDHFISKPFRPSQLLEVVADCTAASRQA